MDDRLQSVSFSKISSALQFCWESLLQSVKSSDMLRQMQGGVVVALSGGADSVCLLYLMDHLGKACGFPVYAVHVNHGIRGDEALRDENFCRELCANWQIPITVCHASIPLLAKKEKCSIETCARRVRYRFLEEQRMACGASAIATAHNATDQAETVLMHLLRGAGVHGLGGIAPVRGTLLRPLLNCSAERIRLALQEASIPYVTDSTNFDKTYRRNYVRQQLLPQMEYLTKDPVAVLARNADTVREEDLFLEDMAEKLVQDATDSHGFSRTVLAKAPCVILRRALRRICCDMAKEGEYPNRAHLLSLEECICSARTHFKLSLPGELVAVGERDRVCVLRNQTKGTSSFSVPLQMGENLLPDGCMLYVSDVQNIESQIERNVYKLSIHTKLPSATIENGWYARGRNSGDVLLYGGMHHKVKKMFSDAKLPLDLRQTLPLVCDSEGILWIPHFPVRDHEKNCKTVFVTYFYDRMD